jgi:soluble lytic murein transglycosylase
MFRILLISCVTLMPLRAAGQDFQDSPQLLQQALMLGEWLEYQQALAILDSLPGDSLSGYSRVRFLFLAGDNAEAARQAGLFIERWPESPLAVNCKWHRGLSLKKLGLYRDALYDFLELSRQDHLLSDIAWMNAASCLRVLGLARKADQILDSLASLNRPGEDSLIAMLAGPGNREAPRGAVPPRQSSVHKAGRLISRGKYSQARELLVRYIRHNPGSSYLGQAQYLIGKCFEREGRLGPAAQAYAGVPAKQPRSSWADEGLFRAGWCHYKMKEYSAAVRLWREVQSRYPDSDHAEVALFWQAKAGQRTGKHQEARERYLELAAAGQHSYYGWRAREHLRDFFGSGDSLPHGRLPQMAFLDSAAYRPDYEFDSWVKAHRLYLQASRLAELGLAEEAGQLLEYLRRSGWNDPVALYHLAQIYNRTGRDPQAILCAKRSFDLWLGPRPRALLEILYPSRYLFSIGRALEDSPLEAALVLSVMRQESKFVSGAISKAGARGLMQIMPATGRRLSGQKNFNKDSLYHPATSINYGTKFLSGLLQQFNGSVVHALAAYNAGPHRVNQWLRSEDCRQDDDYLIEEIPFLETRNYIKKVMVGYYIYRWLMEE